MEGMGKPKRAVAAKSSVNGAAALYAAGQGQHAEGRLAEAAALYGEVLAVQPNHAGALNLLGVLASQGARHEEAARLIRRAVAMMPREASFHINLGLVLRAAGQLAAAAASLRAALKLRPDAADAHLNLGVVLAELGQADEAIGCYRRVLKLRPGDPDALNNLGNLLREQGSWDEAVSCLQRALLVQPGAATAHNNLGVALAEQGQLDEAVAAYRRALARHHDLPEAHYNLGMALLRQGDMAAGWAEYEWRWGTRLMMAGRRMFAQPQWGGEAGAGRTLLIHAEQGFGDTLQFCRYAALASALGWRVVMEVQAPLVRILRGLEGVADVVAHGAALPAFDVHCPMLSLPGALGGACKIPNATYLRPDPAAVADWRGRLGEADGMRVGLVWAGSARAHAPALAALDKRRSVAIARLAPLFEVPGVEWVSLQKDGGAEGFPLRDFMAEMGDFADTAALVESLDLVISVDTAVAHLAAGMGKPVWLLNRFDSCWRWPQGRRDSAWYKSMRIFHQHRPGDWECVVGAVVAALRPLAEGR
jgi:tetratricopeptide (TPR) repeat protein